MTECAPVRIARAVADEINSATAGTFSRAFEAKFSFADALTRFEDINTDQGLLVDVVPAMAPEWATAGQAASRHDAIVKVGFRRRIETTDRDQTGDIASAEIAVYCGLIYEVLGLFSTGATPNSGRELTTIEQASFNPRGKVKIQLYDETLLKQGLYFGWVHIPFVMHEGT